jgi:hypothetical protein
MMPPTSDTHSRTGAFIFQNENVKLEVLRDLEPRLQILR